MSLHPPPAGTAETTAFMPSAAKRPLVKFLPWLVLCLGLAVTYGVQLGAQHAAERARQDLFTFRAHEVARNISARLDNYEQVLAGATGLFAAAPTVDRAQFRDYVARLRLQDRYPGIGGVGFAQRIPAGDRERAVEAVRRAGLPGFRIWPDGARDPYTAIVYLEPLDGRNRRALGYDMYAEPVRHAAMARARDEDRAVISGKVRLVQETESAPQPGFLMYLPVYRHGAPHATAAERRANLVGWVYAPFRMSDLMDGILGRHFHELAATLNLKIYDGRAAAADRLMFDSNAETGANPAALRLNLVMGLFGHEWTVSVTSLPAFDAGQGRRYPWLIVLAGGTVSLLLALVTRLLVERHARVLALAEEMTRELRESEANMEALFENMSSGAAVYRPSEDCEEFFFSALNRSAEHIDNVRREEVIGRNVREVFPGVVAMGLLEVFRRVCRSGVAEDLPASYYQDGRIVGWRENFVYKLPNGHIVSLYDDVSAQQRAEAEQDRLNRALRLLSDCNMALVHAEAEYPLLVEICRLVVKTGGYRMAWVGYAEHDEARTVRPIAQFGYEAGYLDTVDITWADTERGRGPTGTAIRTGRTDVNQSVLTNPRMAPWREAALKRGYQASIALPLVNEGATLGALTIYSADPDAFNREEVRLLEEMAGDLAYGIVTLRTRAERAAAEEKVAFLASFDPLTQLPNRLLLRDRCEHAIHLAGLRHAGLALLYLDLDNFKQVNDSLGHEIGDRLLVVAVDRLRHCLPESDTISRLSDDEFGVLLADTGTPDAAAALAGKILDAFAEPVAFDGTLLNISFSIGISLYPADGGDFDSLLKNAGTAVNHAKEGGRNTYRFYTLQMNVDALAHLTLKGQLHNAVKNGELLLHYQPQVDIASGRIVGAEALVRWQHPTEGLVPPAKFIPLAEQSGHIVQIGEWVLNEACRQAKSWLDGGLGPMLMAVNLSALQFKRGNVQAVVTAALERSGLPPDRLELELTESVLLQDVAGTLATLQALKALGVRLSIDDFGTGYSSLSYLKQLAVDKLKIDQSFVRDLSNDGDDAAIVRAIIQLGQSLQLVVIAEGVETREQFEFLGRNGCHEVQGYLFSRPVPAGQFAALLEKGLLPPA
ncbi:MAG TPA: EAL domain-containing protein [Parasulfuritortus sp.]